MDGFAPEPSESTQPDDQASECWVVSKPAEPPCQNIEDRHSDNRQDESDDRIGDTTTTH